MNSNFVARVALARGERARLVVEGSEMEAIVTGSLAYSAESAAELPVVGDEVEARWVEPSLALIERVLPRRSAISRRAAGRRNEEQVLAANVDVALIVCGLDGDFNVRRMERYLALALEGSVTPVIVLNKADECAEPEARIAEVRAATRAEVFAVSALRGDGCAVIERLLAPDVTAVMLGSSGAGKSTLMNRLLGEDRQSTAGVREHDSRGKHTTTFREMIRLPSGAWLIDTPGLREIQLWVHEDTIDLLFDDIARLAGACRFADCAHQSEPGCAVREGVDAERLKAYHKLQREAARHENTLTEKRRWRSIHKAAKKFYRMRGR